jgi:hypothetical protein
LVTLAISAQSRSISVTLTISRARSLASVDHYLPALPLLPKILTFHFSLPYQVYGYRGMGLSMGTMIAGWYIVQRNVTSRHSCCFCFLFVVLLSRLPQHGPFDGHNDCWLVFSATQCDVTPFGVCS